MMIQTVLEQISIYHEDQDQGGLARVRQVCYAHFRESIRHGQSTGEEILWEQKIS